MIFSVLFPCYKPLPCQVWCPNWSNGVNGARMMQFCAWWPNTISYHLVEFGSDRSSCRVWWSRTMWKQRITFFTRHVTVVSCDDYGWLPLLINHNHFKFGRNGVAEVEIERFLFVTWLHMITWTKEHVTLKLVTPNHKPPSYLV